MTALDPTAEPNLLDLLTPQSETAKPAPDQWLLDHLIRTGHLTETGLSRRARIRTCRCGAATLAGLDDDVCALDAHTDPVPLTPLGEALARVEGRWTWTLTRTRDSFVLDRRDEHKIAHAPAGTRVRTDVVRQHRCDTPLPTHELTTATTFVEIRPDALPPGSPAPF